MNLKPMVFITIISFVIANNLILIPVEAKNNTEPFATVPGATSLHGISRKGFDKSTAVAIEAEPSNAIAGERLKKNTFLLDNNLLEAQIQNGDLSGIWTISSINNTRVSDISCGDVLMLQNALLELGYSEFGVPDGSFGILTDKAVRRYQEENGLTVDGIVGPQTWTRLFTK